MSTYLWLVEPTTLQSLQNSTVDGKEYCFAVK